MKYSVWIETTADDKPVDVLVNYYAELGKAIEAAQICHDNGNRTKVVGPSPLQGKPMTVTL